MTQFLFVFRGGAFVNKNLSPQDLQKHFEKWGAWSAKLEKDGYMEGGNPLVNGGRAIRGQKKTVTDGPYAEAKDLLTGYVLIRAKDIDHATEIAMSCPVYDYEGSLEIRPIREMPG